MKIRFQERNVDITKALRAQVQRRLSLALGHFALGIDKVIVRLGSGKAPSRSNEKHCQIDVTLRARVLSVRDTDATWPPPSMAPSAASHGRWRALSSATSAEAEPAFPGPPPRPRSA